MTELGIVLDFRKKNVHVSNTGIKPISRSLHNLTGTYDVTVKKK